MKLNYIHLYNNFIKLTRNKDLYVNLTKQDTFSDRLMIFLIHFAFFLKRFKKDNDKELLQEIYDFIFQQLELSIREIGYGDQSINKKMKVYINIFHNILLDIHSWDKLRLKDKNNKLGYYLENVNRIMHITKYFDNFYNILTKNSLKSYFKHVHI
jgi:cytochrome b pre-mRNA-processing protein 3